jgi:serine/threonine-protein kinase HipA
MKYQNEGGPDLRACFDLLRRVTRPSAPQILQFLDYVAFNALIGNHDAHGKNFSLLYTRTISDGPVLAPLYDALSTAIYPKLTPKMAMKLGSKYKFSELHARHWDQFAEEAGLSKAQTRKRILGMASKLPEVARQLQATEAFVAEPLVEAIVGLVEQRSALTIRRLNDEALL